MLGSCRLPRSEFETTCQTVRPRLPPAIIISNNRRGRVFLSSPIFSLSADLPQTDRSMTKLGFLAASVAAASAAAASASAAAASASSSSITCRASFRFPHKEDVVRTGQDDASAATNKFCPRFDGLRFIETLVTAHR